MRVHGHNPFNFGQFPQALAGFERLNDRQVNFSVQIPIRGDQYNLRSVVLNEVNRNIPNQNIVVGSSTAIMTHADPTRGQIQNEYFHYNPMGVVDFMPGAPNNHNNPCTIIYGTPGVGQVGYSFQEMGEQRGTIFIYQLAVDNTDGLITV
jgi:hypothetical protein